jgi:thioredoxin 1
MSKLVNLTEGNFEDTIKEGVTLVDFWAPWCGPCRMIGPVIEELASEDETGATIGKVNTDEEQALAQKYGIRSIPTILFFKDGELADTMVGAQSKTDFLNTLKKLS